MNVEFESNIRDSIFINKKYLLNDINYKLGERFQGSDIYLNQDSLILFIG